MASKSHEVYQYLVNKAIDKDTTTYQEIALANDLPSTGNNMSAVLSPILSNIFFFCLTHKLPYLTSIVVRKSGGDQGLPGQGFWKLLEATSEAVNGNLHQAHKRVLTSRFQDQVWEAYHSGASIPNPDTALLELVDQDSDVIARAYYATLPDDKEEIAPLPKQTVDQVIEVMRVKLAKEFGVTVVQDHNGAHGPAGMRYMTLRFGDHAVSFQVTSIESQRENAAHNAWLREDK